VGFPQFPDIHHLIPQILHLTQKAIVSHNYPYIDHEDSGKWEIYVKYRQIVSQFLTDRTRSGSLFVGQRQYVDLAKCLALFLTEDMG
jgi:hypothetical protein